MNKTVQDLFFQFLDKSDCEVTVENFRSFLVQNNLHDIVPYPVIHDLISNSKAVAHSFYEMEQLAEQFSNGLLSLPELLLNVQCKPHQIFHLHQMMSLPSRVLVKISISDFDPVVDSGSTSEESILTHPKDPRFPVGAPL